MKIRTLFIASIAAAISQMASAANTLPLSSEWSIQASGNATTTGRLHFRVTPGSENPVDVTVPVMSGASDIAIARYIQRALSSQLRADRIDVEVGEGANVLVKSGKAGFSLELVDSDVENVRIAVQSATPAVPPTVPKQATPAEPPLQTTPATPPAHGDAVPPDSPRAEDTPVTPPLLGAVLRLPTPPRFRARFP